MSIAMIAAMARGNVIGYQGQLPWHVSTDLKYFKTVTLGKPVIMGRKTYESIGKALPGRQNIIVTNNPYFAAAECDIADSLEQAILLAHPEVHEVMIIGGAQLFEQGLFIADKLYLTLLDMEILGDAYFPEWRIFNWHETESINFFDEKAQVSGKFITLERRDP
ncbi:MAG: dihydrofolate reductase [Legionellales bacterium]|nr:dihydrofolate reductase [Legionellales bacterium]